MGSGHAHEVAAFARAIDDRTRLAAEEAYLVCAELRGVLTAVCAVGTLAASDGSTRHVEVGPLLARLRGARLRLRGIDDLEPAQLRDLLAASGDLERALEGVAGDHRAVRIGPWDALLDCYAAMSRLRCGLWAFELRPEGLPLSVAGRSDYEEGFRLAAAVARAPSR